MPNGYFVYRHMSDDDTFKFNINQLGKSIAVSKEYPVFSVEGMDPYFLQYLLNESSAFKRFAIAPRIGKAAPDINSIGRPDLAFG